MPEGGRAVVAAVVSTAPTAVASAFQAAQRGPHQVVNVVVDQVGNDGSVVRVLVGTAQYLVCPKPVTNVNHRSV